MRPLPRSLTKPQDTRPRWAKSYSIVDHGFFHGGYFQKLSHAALVLYFFLVVVSDKNGRSFYSESTLVEILRLLPNQLEKACVELMRLNLIDYRKPYWWVQNIPPVPQQNLENKKNLKSFKSLKTGESDERSSTKNTLSQRRPGSVLPADPRPVGDFPKEGLESLRKILFAETKPEQ